MTQHGFIFAPGDWLGEGEVSFSASEERLKFHTLWQVFHNETDPIELRHTVEIVGVPDKVVNKLEVDQLSDSGFRLFLTNDMVDRVEGKGLVEPDKIGWEFRGEPGFEGIELYTLKEDGSYSVHAEYLSSEQFRTVIDGRIWKRTTEQKDEEQ